MNKEHEILSAALPVLKEKSKGFVPELVIVLGSGLGELAGMMKNAAAVNFREIPGIPCSSVAPERSQVLFGDLCGMPTALLGYRLHLYEGFTPAETVRPLRLLRMLGARYLLFTNASGCINSEFRPGEMMLIDDHISFLVESPLRGTNLEELGPRYPDMSEVYDRSLRKILAETAEKEKIPLHHGVYMQTPGPQFETPAEIRFCGRVGADVIGMSSATEAIAARHCGYRIAGISCISNYAAGISGKPITVEEVYEKMKQLRPKLTTLISGMAAALKNKEI